MRIGGLQPSSLIDFPGTVAAVIFTVGCNFRCPYCHNPDLVLESPEREYTEEEILVFLLARKGLLPAVVITGGEPTMHEDLPRFIKKIKMLGYRVKLDTNGTNPAMVRSLVEDKLVDYIAMDIKAPRARYPEIVGAAVDFEAIRTSVEYLLTGAVEYEFRTTVVRSQLSPSDLEDIGKEIRGAKRYFLQQFQPAITLHPSFRTKLSYSLDEFQKIADRLSPYVEHCTIRI